MVFSQKSSIINNSFLAIYQMVTQRTYEGFQIVEINLIRMLRMPIVVVSSVGNRVISLLRYYAGFTGSSLHSWFAGRGFKRVCNV